MYVYDELGVCELIRAVHIAMASLLFIFPPPVYTCSQGCVVCCVSGGCMYSRMGDEIWGFQVLESQV